MPCRLERFACSPLLVEEHARGIGDVFAEAVVGSRDGWLQYENEVASVAPAGSPAVFERPAVHEEDLLTINYTEIARESITMFCAAPTVLIGVANAPEEVRRGAPRGIRVLTAGAPPAAATIARVEGELGWEVTQVYGLTETAPFITICEPRPEHEVLSGGENISSIEVEGTLLKHGAVQEVAVVGMPDAQWGEAPHAFVVPRAGVTVDDRALREFVREHLAHFKCPHGFHFVNELPKTATGKVQKYVLRGGRTAIATQ
jgi:acyl-CoA synthetase (AMP-forming)/AMP-acid ligase II